ncbi:FecCD family ABC transporter permease [Nocardia macrotermitis]|uniref:Ferric enterobactin transport system permease protein FepG n=1 Tax=Nocardia macrotermitis TaxID=2585198 RepID=A0A7K0DBK8_9NOCA|nr:iron chelate uptake ABC transporter family permease subunit [Nocardia macrotermitis]MQY23117.1 Ferric enterobactin transport system permease protein FepG [Nocardia macrotermitis]
MSDSGVASDAKPVLRQRPAVRIGPISVVRRPGVLTAFLALAVLLVVLAVLDVWLGGDPIPLPQLLNALSGGGNGALRFIVWELRMPRTATAPIVGAALGLAGAITQSILRNPLAAPDLLGITAGASLAATATTVAGGAFAASVFGVPLAALGGGLLTAAAIYLFAWRGGEVAGFRLVLIGIGVNAILVAGVGWLLVSAQIQDIGRAQVWLNGSLDDTSWTRFWPTAAAFVIVLAITLSAARSLAALRFGPEIARSLGVRVQWNQGLLLTAAAALAALATSACGPVAFVALATPQIARRITRTAGEPLFGSALTGSVLVTGSDLLARAILPQDLPVGVVTAGFGGCYLLYSLVRSNRKASV